jgi:hypothetical protein
MAAFSSAYDWALSMPASARSNKHKKAKAKLDMKVLNDETAK